MIEIINRPKGTQDILPDEIELWHYIEETIRSLTQLYSFIEIRTPIFEATELFERSVGETTDVVQKEMYTFVDKGGRSVTLRPEATACIVRAYMENGMINQGAPRKLYYMGPMFRYERPQAGRLRQFHQFGIETIGSAHPTADFEVIEFSVALLRQLKLEETKLTINSIGCQKCRPQYREALKAYYLEKLNNLCEDCQRRYEVNVLRLLDCKVDKEATAGAPSILDYLCDECAEHFDQVKDLLVKASIEYEIDPRLVRGLDYYTRTAFEINTAALGGQSQILGGGRYDGLGEFLGGKPIPAVGFAAGLERIVMLLKKQRLDIEAEEGMLVSILPLGDAVFHHAFDFASRIRRRGIPVFVDVMNRNLSNRLKHAGRIGTRLAVVFGDNELEASIVTVKNMIDGSQAQVDAAYLEDYIEEKLELS